MPGPSESPALSSLIQALAAEPRTAERQKLLAAAPAEWTPAAVALLYEEVVRLVRIDLRQAERLARSADWIARKIGDLKSRALAFRAVGHVHYLRGEHAEARQRYLDALTVYERLGEDLEIGRTLNGSLQTLIYLGFYDEAYAAAERARAIFARHGDRLRLARLDSNLANILYRQDRFEEALDLYRRAHAGLVEAGDFQDAAIALRNMAVCQISLNDFPGALETYEAVKSWCAEKPMPLLVAEADYNIAYLHYLRGEYTRAIELYRSAREHCESLGDNYHQGLCDLDQSELYLELNLSEEGAHLAERALGAFRRLGMRYETAKALANLAIASAHHGRRKSSLNLFRQARDLFAREKNRAWMAMVDLYQALVLYEEKDLDQARSLCEAALGFFAPTPWTGKTALCELLLARIRLDAGDAAEARSICLAALERLEGAETPALLYQAWFVLGGIEEALGRPGEAYEAYRKAHGRLENLRSQLRTEELKIAFLENKLAVYENLVRMCLDQGESEERLEEAFAYIEQAKSRSLADLIAFRAQSIPASNEAHRALVERIGKLRRDLNWHTHALRSAESRTEAPASPYAQRLRQSAADCERNLVEALAQLRVRDQESASLQNAAAVELDDIRSVLPADAMLVQYYRVRDDFYVCLLSRRTLRIVRLGPAAELRRVMQLLRFQLSKFRLGPEYVDTFYPQLVRAANAHLQEFYEKLVAPVARHLDAAHLIVAPHGFLHYLPFHALLDGSQYLGDRFSLSYTPSAGVFYHCARRKAGAGGRSLVLGIPDPAAPEIAREVAAVAAALPGSAVYMGDQATLEVLRDQGPGSRFVHIATHGWFRQDNPMFSSISLGNSLLSLFDLYQLSLPSELITLSGCGTGLNVVVGGDELLGLVRGLLYAGAEGVLVTLWDVHDRSTSEFMAAFYRRLQGSTDKAKALQQAMAEIRERHAHPFYWAPFILVGKYNNPPAFPGPA